MRKVAVVALASMFLAAPTMVLAETANTNPPLSNSIMVTTTAVMAMECMATVIIEVTADNEDI